ncbi:DUF1905 domain-containing protein [Formosa sp. S-31]|uniref:DUF1905 domain-containing protein n=1 Tax=Formosa sp. S-31 TaxID=2790949 RepID=UPI003EC03B99
MKGRIKYEFKSTLWKHDGTGGWYFVSLPKPISKEIREHLKWQEEGWGRLKIIAGLGGVVWDTAIWFDTKRNTYLLPVKAEIRKKLSLQNDDFLSISIWI